MFSPNLHWKGSFDSFATLTTQLITRGCQRLLDAWGRLLIAFGQFFVPHPLRWRMSTHNGLSRSIFCEWLSHCIWASYLLREFREFTCKSFVNTRNLWPKKTLRIFKLRLHISSFCLEDGQRCSLWGYILPDQTMHFLWKPLNLP